MSSKPMLEILLDLDMMALLLREGDRTRILCCNSNALKSKTYNVKGDWGRSVLGAAQLSCQVIRWCLTSNQNKQTDKY
ncbi:hypothetical protein [Chlorogloeopsis sp. ULAP02]|uniref:hypothetical protein n=1 Tax=Chlorogloeopsis sp. ULAP02 TaxID=3107926 RepID=UPI003134A487